MCMACEEEAYFYRLYVADKLARGEMPDGLTPEDLEAMGFEVPASMKSEASAQSGAKRLATAAGAFSCDSPDRE